MFSKKSTIPYTKNYSEQMNKLSEWLEQSDAILIGAGAGLSTAAGFIYDGEHFRNHFSDFEQKYGFRDMYSGGFYAYETLEEYWAYWSRFIALNRFQDAMKPLYDILLQLVKDKDYFVLTTNVDHCFQKAGFGKQRLFYTQGDYGLFQCCVPCHNKTYENEEVIRRMVQEQKNMRVPTELIPYCPVCGKPMTMNLRSDHTFLDETSGASVYNQCGESPSKYLLYQDVLLGLFDEQIKGLELGVYYHKISEKLHAAGEENKKMHCFFNIMKLWQCCCIKKVSLGFN